MTSSIISCVLRDCYPQLECSLYSAQLVGHLYSNNCINSEDKQEIEAGATQFAKSRKLIDILCTKADWVLDHILTHLQRDGTQSHLESIIASAASKFGYGGADAGAEMPTQAIQPKVQIFSHKWWPEHKEMIKSFVARTASDGSSLAEYIHQQLLNSDSNAAAIISRKQVIVGMGGIGKTSTAKWYANIYQDKYDHIFWMDSEGASLSNSMESLGKKLGFPRESMEPLAEFAKKIYERLEATRCLFIFDNAERFEGENGLRAILPRNELHHSIITSRNHDWGNPNEFGQIPAVPLDVFTPEEGVTLLCNTLTQIGKGGSNQEMRALGEELGFLPLALQCAVATIMKSRMYTLASYTKRIKEDLKMLMDKRILSEYERPISATLRITIEQIEKDDDIDADCREACKTILYIVAYCEPNDIPEALFLHLPNLDRNVVIAALDILLQYSLISDEGFDNGWGSDESAISDEEFEDLRMFGCHRLLQHVVRNQAVLDSELAIQAVKLAFDSMKAIRTHFPDPLILNHAVQVWTLAADQFDEILRTCFDFPFALTEDLLCGYWFPGQFLKDAVITLKRRFKEIDIPIVQLQLFLIYGIVSRKPEEAKAIIDGMLDAIAIATDGSVPHMVQLNLHLRVVELEVRKHLMWLGQDYGEDLLVEYEGVVNELRETRYDGIIEGTKLCYPSELEKNGLNLLHYVEVCYALRLHAAGKSEKAINVLSDTLKTVGEALDIDYLGCICGNLYSVPDLLHQIIRAAFQTMRPSLLATNSVGFDLVHVAKKMTKMYTEALLKTNPISSADAFEVLEFLLEFDWNQKGHGNPCAWVAPFLQLIISLKECQQDPVRFENTLRGGWEKLMAAVNTTGSGGTRQLAQVLTFNNMLYSLHDGSSK